jgi:hypothetical protein
MFAAPRSAATVIVEGASKIDSHPATRTEFRMHEGGWEFYTLLYALDVNGRSVGLLFLANDRSFDAALFDEVAASARFVAESPTPS